MTAFDLNGKVRIIKRMLKIIFMNNELIAKNKCIINTIILIFGISAGILGYFQHKQNFIPNPPISPGTTLTPPKEVWETYTNPQLGFSIKYPQMVYGVYRCSPDKPFYVPLKVFEDNENGIVYIAEEYYYDDWDSKSQSNTGLCKKIIHSLESLKKERETIVDVNDKVRVNANPFLTRVFVIKNVNNDSELNKFIKDSHGQGCFAEKKEPWKQNDVYEIEIRGEDWDKADLGTTTCPLHYKYKILYAPGKNKVVSVILGQECGFGTNPASESYKCYDEEMIDSFKFE